MATTKALETLRAFAERHAITLELDGTVGVRPCVGFLRGTEYVRYNPFDMTTFEAVAGFEGSEIEDAAPPNAHHEHRCLAVLIETDKDTAIAELADWALALAELDLELVEYETGARGPQLLITPARGHALRVRRPGR